MDHLPYEIDYEFPNNQFGDYKIWVHCEILEECNIIDLGILREFVFFLGFMGYFDLGVFDPGTYADMQVHTSHSRDFKLISNSLSISKSRVIENL